MKVKSLVSGNEVSLGNNGVILISVIIILLTIALIGASLMAFFFSVNLSVRATASEAKAFYLAEAGIAHAVNTLKSQASVLEQFEQTIGPVPLGEGDYTVTIDYIQSLIISIGEVEGIKKTLQLQYASF